MKRHSGKQSYRRAATAIGAVVASLAVAAATSALAQPAGAASSGSSASGYIVVLESQLTTMSDAATSGHAHTLAQRFGGDVGHVYNTALHGFSVRMAKEQAQRMAADESVAYVVPDTPVRVVGEGVQPNPPSWGLDRIDQRDNNYDHRYWYANKARSVTAYVIDTGVYGGHQDFDGRVSGGYDFIDNDTDPADDNGHGTFIAGIIGGTDYGVAKKVNIVPVRVLDGNGSGTISGVIAGIEWVTENAEKPAVANMSLGGSANEALDQAVRNSIASGVTYTFAAGGSATDASLFSPARVAEGLTIAASDASDCVASFNNHGPVIDMYAPGVEITGPWISSDTASLTISGSSVAAPHVAGGAAIYLHDNPDATPAEVASALTQRSTKDVLCNVPADTPNRLLYTGP